MWQYGTCMRMHSSTPVGGSVAACAHVRAVLGCLSPCVLCPTRALCTSPPPSLFSLASLTHAYLVRVNKNNSARKMRSTWALAAWPTPATPSPRMTRTRASPSPRRLPSRSTSNRNRRRTASRGLFLGFFLRVGLCGARGGRQELLV